MTDSDSDIADFPFQNGDTTVRAKGPSTNITNLSFQSRMTSTMCNMSRNFKRPTYDSMCDQRSLYYRRETSPMSVYSACDARQRNYQQFNTMRAQRSMFNGRSVSPTMSLRSIDSTASLSAADIAFAFKNVQFNKCDLKIIKDAYASFMNNRKRQRYGRIEKRRRFLQRRRRSGADSADQESNSSLSSDECRSVKTCGTMSSRLGRSDMAHFRRTVRDSNILKDCTESFSQNNFKNMLSLDNNTLSNYRNSSRTTQPKHTLTQKDRFQNRLLLPSQRFNRSVASQSIPESSEGAGSRPQKDILPPVKNISSQKIRNTQMSNGKINSYNESLRRPLDVEESSFPNNKRMRISSPAKICKTVKTREATNNNCDASNKNGMIFEFVKPSLPARRSKPKVQEVLISKSAPQLVDLIQPPPKITDECSDILPSDMQEQTIEDQTQTTLSSTQNDSTRPSFIKRKLFTQKLDVADKAASSSDSTNSPQQSMYSKIQKEKNKSRKLVTNQSCLNKEVNDESNLLDLIHKIVTPDQINMTTQSMNHTKQPSKKSKENDDKWDVTSVISMCNENEGSDTYTDEDIFEGKKAVKKKPEEKKINHQTRTSDSQTDTEVKTVENKVTRARQVTPCRVVLKPLNTSQKTVHQTNITQNNAKLIPFWDTDTTDDECPASIQKLKEKLINDIIPVKDTTKNSIVNKSIANKCLQHKESVIKEVNNKTVVNNTFDSMKFNLKTLTVRSHRDIKRKKRFNESDTILKENVDTTFKNIVTSKKQMIDTQNILSSTLEPNQPKASNPKTKTSSHSSKINSKVENNGLIESKSNSDIQNKKSCKSKPTDKNNANKIKTQTAKDTNVTKSKYIKTIGNKVNTESKPIKEDKANEPNSKSEKQKPKSNNKVEKPKEKAKVSSKYQNKTNKQSPNSKNTRSRSQSKTNTSNRANVSYTRRPIREIALINSNITLNTSRNADRLIRSCRTPKLIQNESIDYSLNSDLKVSCEYKNLRSRIINLSSSIENITFNIKPKNKRK